MDHDWTIIGAGFTGATFAERLATQMGQRVLLIDRRDHIGGNAYDYVNDHGHLVHRYGPHIFHTNAPHVSAYLSQFTDWINYEHRVVGVINGRLVPIPFNFTSIDILFSAEKAALLKQRLIAAYGLGQKVTIFSLRMSPDTLISELANFIFDNVFDGYTRKQWGVSPEELNASVTDRVPVQISYDDRYFQDSFQKMPRHGYTKLFASMLDNENIEISLNATIEASKIINSKQKTIYTGAIDEFFDYCYGPLEYRSLRFDFQTYHQSTHQSVGQVNYPVSCEHTRITEFRHLTLQNSATTTVAIEYPEAHIPGQNVPYYPVPRDRNKLLYIKYRELSNKIAPHVLFVGRLADYQYYNMDQAVARALAIFNKEILMPQ